MSKYIIVAFLFVAGFSKAQEENYVLNGELQSFACGDNGVQVSDWVVFGNADFSALCEGSYEVVLPEGAFIISDLMVELTPGREYIVQVEGRGLHSGSVMFMDVNGELEVLNLSEYDLEDSKHKVISYIPDKELEKIVLARNSDKARSILKVSKVSVAPGDPDDPDGLDESGASERGVYPNPCRSELHMKGLSNAIVYDLLGQQVMVCPGDPVQVDISWLPKGQYIIKGEEGRAFSFVKL